MKKEMMQKIIMMSLKALDFGNSSLNPDETIHSFIHIKERHITFKSVISYDAEKEIIGVELQYNLRGEEFNQEELQLKLDQINELLCFKRDDERWMRWGLTQKPIHLLIVIKIQFGPEDEIDKMAQDELMKVILKSADLDEKLKTMLKIIDENWPL